MTAAVQTETDAPKQEEWTFVKSKSRFRRRPPRVPTPATTTASKTDEPRTYKSTADITAEYETFKTRWRETPCHAKIRELVRQNAGTHRRVRRAVCLGVGTFDPEDGGWDAKRRSHIQLDGFLTVVEVLSEIYSDSIPCSFQEPRFTPNDAEFLTNLGHEVVESPRAFEAVDEDTLVFAIHMYRPIYEAALEKALPAMFVGTGWDVWDGVGTLKEGDFKCMSDMHDSHKQFEFPQDGTYTSFSSTCLYWRPKSEELPREGIEDAKVETEAVEEKEESKDSTEERKEGEPEAEAPSRSHA
ncbi:hypothetical protein CPLU01_13274 [Colletotrichum plurivorum]|uniref:SRR1-like domain-containing protein n=1 Tax=Colletotrichum plurivorum TaxID=2175906 RepID=A0A8H6JTC7_9PEZI|nr:hypothetical protein CPLU01_13274 [Colletotrichum plurivorum]